MQYFLPRKYPEGSVRISFDPHQTVKHMAESLGVPHVEMGTILANGQPVDPGYQPHDGDRIDVEPNTSDYPGENPRFMLDNHLGRLAACLRMLGFDCLYRNDFQDAQMARMLASDERILLSRDRRLLMRKIVHFGYCPRSLQPEEQLREVVCRFHLIDHITPFNRCLRCNHLLEPVSKESVLDRLEPLTKKYYHEFVRCPSCSQVYWKGSHYEHMIARIRGLKA